MNAEISSALNQFLSTVVIALIGLMGVVCVSLIKQAKNWVQTKTASIENEWYRDRINSELDRLGSIVCTVVDSIEQEEKQEILKAIQDGKIDRSELTGLRDKAVSRIINQLVPETQEFLSCELGDLSAYVADLVSQRVLTLKNNK